MKNNNVIIGCMVVFTIIACLCSCENIVKKFLRNREREKIVNELLMLKNELPQEIDNTGIVITDANVDGDTLVCSCTMTEGNWDLIKPTVDKANNDRNVARVVESMDESYINKLIAGGMGFKYIYRHKDSNKYLFSVTVAPERLKDIKDRMDRGVLKPYNLLELSQMEIDKMKFPCKIDEEVWLTNAYIRSNSIFYEGKVDAEIEPSESSAADVADMRQGVIEGLKEEPLLKVHKKSIVSEGIHFVYIFRDSRGVEFARIDVGPEVFMYE